MSGIPTEVDKIMLSTAFRPDIASTCAQDGIDLANGNPVVVEIMHHEDSKRLHEMLKAHMVLKGKKGIATRAVTIDPDSQDQEHPTSTPVLYVIRTRDTPLDKVD